MILNMSSSFMNTHPYIVMKYVVHKDIYKQPMSTKGTWVNRLGKQTFPLSAQELQGKMSSWKNPSKPESARGWRCGWYSPRESSVLGALGGAEGAGGAGADPNEPLFPKALRRVLPENPLNTDTSTLTPTH